jgi:hypothetical protein
MSQSRPPLSHGTQRPPSHHAEPLVQSESEAQLSKHASYALVHAASSAKSAPQSAPAQ